MGLLLAITTMDIDFDDVEQRDPSYWWKDGDAYNNENNNHHHHHIAPEYTRTRSVSGVGHSRHSKPLEIHPDPYKTITKYKQQQPTPPPSPPRFETEETEPGYELYQQEPRLEREEQEEQSTKRKLGLNCTIANKDQVLDLIDRRIYDLISSPSPSPSLFPSPSDGPSRPSQPLEPRPPSIEYIFVEPYTSHRLYKSYLTLSFRPFGHSAVRYTLPDGTQKLVNISKQEGVKLVAFYEPHEWLYGLAPEFEEQGGVYTRHMVGIRVENVADEDVLALDEYYRRLGKQYEDGLAKFDTFGGALIKPFHRCWYNLTGCCPRRHRSSTSTHFEDYVSEDEEQISHPSPSNTRNEKDKPPIVQWGNCANWISRGLKNAGLLRTQKLFPKIILVDILEQTSTRFGRPGKPARKELRKQLEKKQSSTISAKLSSFWQKYFKAPFQPLLPTTDPTPFMIPPKDDNVHIVFYKRIEHAHHFFGKHYKNHHAQAWVSGSPFTIRKAIKWSELHQLADVVVEVPDGTDVAVVKTKEEVIKEEEEERARRKKWKRRDREESAEEGAGGMM